MNASMSLEVRDDGIARLRMQDETSQNVFSDAFIGGLIENLEQLSENENVKVLILSGLPDVFSAGADKQNLLDLAAGKVHVKDLLISEKLIEMPFPVIAAMTGHAVGGGFIMALCSDIVIAARESRYGVVFMSLGFTPGMGCTKLLEGLVGPYIANEMMYTGKCFKGRELAEKATNINYILPKAEVMAQAENIALQIGEKNVKSIRLLKQALSGPKRKLLAAARIQEDRMHRISFAFPETKQTIEDAYGK